LFAPKTNRKTRAAWCSQRCTPSGRVPRTCSVPATSIQCSRSTAPSTTVRNRPHKMILGSTCRLIFFLSLTVAFSLRTCFMYFASVYPNFVLASPTQLMPTSTGKNSSQIGFDSYWTFSLYLINTRKFFENQIKTHIFTMFLLGKSVYCSF